MVLPYLPGNCDGFAIALSMMAQVFGIDYEPNGDAYNLYFEHFSPALDVKEIVMYIPRNQHQMTSHDMDLLHFSGHELDLRRGYPSSHPAGAENWKCFLFD